MNSALPLPFLLGNNTSYPSSPPYGTDPQYSTSFYTNDFLGESDYGIENRRDTQGISPFVYPTPANPSYNPSAFHSSQNPSPQRIQQPNQIQQHSIPHQPFLPNFLDLPGPSTYNTPLYNNTSSPIESGSRGGVSADNDGSIKVEGVAEEADDDLQDEGNGDGEEGDVEGDGEEEGGEEGEGEDVDNEEPLYVNAKQYHRILKRRAARQRLEELNRLARSRKPYLHESRHRHACSRPRGKGGRFLTAEEIEALKKEEAGKGAAIT